MSSPTRIVVQKLLNHSDIKFADGSQIIMTEGSSLLVNMTNFEHPMIKRTLLYMGKNSKFIVDGEFTMFEGASIYIGDNATLEVHGSSFMNASEIDCSNHIVIGDDVAIASGCLIQDSDYHRILSKDMTEKDSAIHLGDHTWICTRATILKGVTLGAGSVVAAGSLVTKDVPAASLAGGVPARVLRENIVWKG